MIAGFSMTMICKFVIQDMEFIGPIFVALETMPPSFLSALIVGYIVTIVWPDDELAAQYQADLDSIGHGLGGIEAKQVEPVVNN
jgi:hypothetical protein